MFIYNSGNYHWIFSWINSPALTRTPTVDWVHIKAFQRQLEQKPRRKVLIHAENLRFYMSALLTSHFLICRLKIMGVLWTSDVRSYRSNETKISTSRKTFVRWKLFSVATDLFSSRQAGEGRVVCQLLSA